MKKLLLFGLVLILLSSFVSGDLVSGNLAWLSMDDSSISGSTIGDETGNYDGTNSGVTTGVAGILREQLENTAAGNEVSWDNLASAVSSNGGFIHAWFGPNNVPPAARGIWSLDDGTNNEAIRIEIRDIGGGQVKFYFIIRDGGSSFCNGEFGDAFTPFSQKDVVVDGNSSRGTVKFYVDGVLKESRACTKWWDSLTGLNNGAIFNTAYDGNRGFDGKIDELGVWDRNIDDNSCTVSTTCGGEVAQLYNSGSGFNPYDVATEFTIMADDTYTGAAITTFSANITNSSGTFTESTTNGTIYSPIDGTVNITTYSAVYIEETYLNIDTTTSNLDADMVQTKILIVAKDGLNNTLSTNYTWNMTDETNSVTKTGLVNATGAFEPASGTPIEFSFQVNSSAFIITNHTYTFNTYDEATYNATFAYKPIELTFVDAGDLTPLSGANITVYFPGGEEVTYQADASGLIEVPVIYNNKKQVGSYTFEFQSYPGYVSPVNITRTINEQDLPYSEQIGITAAGITVNIYDRESKELLTGTEVDVVILGILNKTTSTGIVNIVDETFVAGDYTIQAFADGYITEQQDITFTGLENETLDIYLLNATGPNTAFLFTNVIDDFYRVQQGARVSMYEYDPSVKAFTKVSEKLSNSNGEAIFAVELNVKTYYFTASKTIEGDLFRTETLPEIVQTENEIRNLVLKLDSFGFTNPTDYLLININETFQNNISTIYIDFTTIDNFVTTVCVEYFTRVLTNETSVYRQCVESSAAYTATPILLNRSNYYIARVFQNDSNNIYPLAEYRYPSVTELNDIFDEDNLTKYIILFLWVLVIVLMFKSENLMLLVILGLILSWAELAWFPSVKTAAASALKTLILILMFFTARKKEDLN